MIVLWLKLAAVAAALALAGWGGWQLRDGQAAKAELARQQAGAKDAHRRGEIALRGSQQFEADREAIQARLRAATGRLAAALAAPVPQCPALAVGDVVVPAAALDGLRHAAGSDGPAADAREPRPTVPERASDPGG